MRVIYSCCNLESMKLFCSVNVCITFGIFSKEDVHSCVMRSKSVLGVIRNSSQLVMSILGQWVATDLLPSGQVRASGTSKHCLSKASARDSCAWLVMNGHACIVTVETPMAGVHPWRR